MEWFKNLSKEIQQLLVGITIFCSSFIFLVIGGSILINAFISLPMILVGLIGLVVAAFCLITSLIDWW